MIDKKIIENILSKINVKKYTYDKVYFGVSFFLKDHFELKNKLSTFALILIIYFIFISSLFKFMKGNILDVTDIINIENNMKNVQIKDGIMFITSFFDQINLSIGFKLSKIFMCNEWIGLLIIIFLLLHLLFLLFLFCYFRAEILLLVLPIIMYYLSVNINNINNEIFSVIFFTFIIANIFMLFFKFRMILEKDRTIIYEEFLYNIIIVSLYKSFTWKFDYRISFIACLISIFILFYMVNKQKDSLDYFLLKAICSIATLIFSVIFVSEKSFIIVHWIYTIHIIEGKFILIALFEKMIDGYLILFK